MTNANLFRRFADAEDQMLRASMPRVNANDPKPARWSRTVELTAVDRRSFRAPRVAPVLTYTIADVAKGQK
jgi:hypothetical protein